MADFHLYGLIPVAFPEELVKRLHLYKPLQTPLYNSLSGTVKSRLRSQLWNRLRFKTFVQLDKQVAQHLTS
jgi:hypothetical protein